ncbi:MAG: HRDC domain-containing protein [Chloroflexi bacterium]|nr:HRDC domain-containing protein [Chloroflexota bacterium]
MPDPELPPPVWVDTPSRLATLAADLNAQSIIAVDTESNSLHAYRERVCLIQFSTIAADSIVDPLALPDLSPLATPLANPAIEKVFHAAEYDLICLRRDFGWKINSIFDTMVAARTLGWQQLGLAALLETYFGAQVNKRHQRADWGKRPLPPDQLSYARFDTHYLIPLREKLAAELNTKACWAEAREEFERLTHLNGNAAAVIFDPENFWRISGARDLKPRQAAILRELYIYREEAARRINRPPFKVMSEATLLALTEAVPHTLDDLKVIPGMTDGQIRRHGTQLLRVIAHGRKAHPQHPPSVERQDSDVLERYEILRRWRKQRAQERGVESDVIIPRDVLWEIALHPPQSFSDLESVAGFGPVRRAKYGEEIIKALKEMK